MTSPMEAEESIEELAGVHREIHAAEGGTLLQTKELTVKFGGLSTVHTGTAPQVMASLRNTVLNMHRLTGADNIAEACGVTAFRADRGLDLLTDHRISRSQACLSTTPDP